jgi:hypothetical protein
MIARKEKISLTSPRIRLYMTEVPMSTRKAISNVFIGSLPFNIYPSQTKISREKSKSARGKDGRGIPVLILCCLEGNLLLF